MANDAKAKPPQELSAILASAAQKALGGGVSGALAMVVQVVALMWMRTTINFQHKYGMSTSDALAALYSQGGIARFYQGMTAALLQAPLSRFGDTASYAGMTALLETVDHIPASLKTLCASLTAALFRIGITPIDTFKTTLQVEGAAGILLLKGRIAQHGVLTLYDGALGSSFATLVGHYPWFLTYDFLQRLVPPASSGVTKQLRSAIIGFICAFTSDVVSNSVRVVKTAKQTSATQQSYAETVTKIVASDGWRGLFFRGLGTKLVSNGLQAMLFTIVWRWVQEKLEARRKRLEQRKEA